MTVKEALAILLKQDVTHIEQAIEAFPQGPLRAPTTRSSVAITYDVFVGERHIWQKIVYFGDDARSRAAGYNFVQASREQDAVSFAALTLLENGTPHV